MSARASAKVAMEQRILETADRLFYQQGIRVVGVDTVAAEIGISKRTRDADVAAGLTERFFLKGTAVAGRSIPLIDPEKRMHQTGCRQDVTDAPH
jgi:Bacterial regulatory proteins, tetR family